MIDNINNFIMSHEVIECANSFSTNVTISTPAINDQRGDYDSNIIGNLPSTHNATDCPIKNAIIVLVLITLSSVSQEKMQTMKARKCQRQQRMTTKYWKSSFCKLST